MATQPESFKLHVEVMATQKQAGTTDCGLYAIAICTSLALNQNPCLQVFSQEDMQSHLIECLSKKNMQPFPLKQTRRIRQFVSRTIVIYMPRVQECRKLESEDMVQCDNCENWWHDSCLTTSYNTNPWYCPQCQCTVTGTD